MIAAHRTNVNIKCRQQLRSFACPSPRTFSLVMIGVKIGTGGSAGHGYLKKTAEKHSIFRDISNLSTYIIPRSALPKLPRKLKKELGFYYMYGK